MSNPPRRSTAAEMEAFCTVCERLGGFDHRTTAEWADGFLTAAAVLARALAPDAVVAQLGGDDFDRVFADPVDQAGARQALQARLAVLHGELDADALYDDPDHLRLSPYMLDWTDEDRATALKEGGLEPGQEAELVTGAEWGAGFFGGVEAFGGLWPDLAEDEYAGELLAQVAALLLAEGSDAQREHLQQTYRDANPDRDRLIDSACFAVQDLWLWAIDHAPRPQTRRVEKTPGRNDPCPCGSGRKFKKCHGA